MWGHAADVLLQFSQHSLSYLSLIWFQATTMWRYRGEQVDCSVSPRRHTAEGLLASLTALQLQRSCFRFRCPFTPAGQVRCLTVILSCHMREVWGERSHCQHFSPSPLKGMKGTALDAICTVGGKLCVSGFGCSSRTVYRVWAQNGKDSCRLGL